MLRKRVAEVLIRNEATAKKIERQLQSQNKPLARALPNLKNLRV
jgi:hypothetical protein